MKIKFEIQDIKGKKGLRLIVLDPTASVQDLLDAIQPFSDEVSIHKDYLEDGHGTCRGCQVNCCRESFVIPDIISFHGLLDYLQLTAVDFLDGYFDAHKVKNGLPRLISGPCIFLKEDICSVYPYRTLICQLYICTPMTGDTEELVYSVVGAGIGELIRNGREQAFLPAWPDENNCGWQLSSALTGYDRIFVKLLEQWVDHPANPFRDAKSYAEVKLKAVCPPDTWLRLLNLGEQVLVG